MQRPTNMKPKEEKNRKTKPLLRTQKHRQFCFLLTQTIEQDFHIKETARNNEEPLRFEQRN